MIRFFETDRSVGVRGAALGYRRYDGPYVRRHKVVVKMSESLTKDRSEVGGLILLFTETSVLT